MKPHQRDFSGNGHEGSAVNAVSVGVQVSISLSPKESRAVKSPPVGFGTSIYCVMFSVTHCHGSGPNVDVGSALGMCVITMSGDAAMMVPGNMQTPRKSRFFMILMVQTARNDAGREV